ncbi:MucR family transcriptional regulator [Maridesulfovibrio bastinii]|uniref:MucR family transcriptional regulator n=1 Tax=Maridesulfovibrio bastinii TaxID=47157 RepID=UPI00040D3003|nr:MucR family transcriptional regulator [Maridesulfovibrio bastinii]
MDKILQGAIEIARAQAGVRIMTDDEILSMIYNLDNSVRTALADGVNGGGADAPAQDPQKAIKEKSITCLECGSSLKIITKRHLAKHDLTADEYRSKWGYAKKQPLVCKSLQRERRKKMKDIQLWKRRG